MPVMTDSREYRKIDIANLETRQEDDGQMIVEGYAATFLQPYTLAKYPDFELREQIDPHAFDETDMDDVIMQYDHEGRVFARKRNGTLELSTDEHGLKIRARLDGTTIGRQLYEEIKGGYTDRMSFGFTVEAERKEEETDSENRVSVLRTITKIRKLYDVSAVSLPANDATEISSRTISDGLIAEAQEEIRAEEERQRKIGEVRKMLKGDTDHDD